MPQSRGGDIPQRACLIDFCDWVHDECMLFFYCCLVCNLTTKINKKNKPRRPLAMGNQMIQEPQPQPSTNEQPNKLRVRILTWNLAWEYQAGSGSLSGKNTSASHVARQYCRTTDSPLTMCGWASSSYVNEQLHPESPKNIIWAF